MITIRNKGFNFKYLFLAFLFLLCYTTHSQEFMNKEEVGKAFEQYFELPREALFLHLNKSTYLEGEELWFKGYVYNR